MKFFSSALSFLFIIFAKLSAQEMTVFLGTTGYQYYENDRRLIQEEVNELLSKNELAYIYWKKSRTEFAVASASGILSLGLFTTKRLEHEMIPFTTALVSLLFFHSGNNKKEKNNLDLQQRTRAPTDLPNQNHTQ
jgi:hypothetical protein